jgi:hypothetical protein
MLVACDADQDLSMLKGEAILAALVHSSNAQVQCTGFAIGESLGVILVKLNLNA